MLDDSTDTRSLCGRIRSDNRRYEDNHFGWFPAFPGLPYLISLIMAHRRLISETMRNWRRSRFARCSRHGRTGGVFSNAGAVHASRGRLPISLLDNVKNIVRRNTEFPTTNSASKGQKLLSDDLGGEQVWSRRRTASFLWRYVADVVRFERDEFAI